MAYINSNLSVVCGSPLAAASSTAVTTDSSTTPITTTSTSTSRLSSVVSTELSSAKIQNGVNGTESTGTTVSEDCTCICGHKDEIIGIYIYHFLNFSNIGKQCLLHQSTGSFVRKSFLNKSLSKSLRARDHMIYVGTFIFIIS